MTFYVQTTPSGFLVHPKSAIFGLFCNIWCSKIAQGVVRAYNSINRNVLRVKSYCLKVPSDKWLNSLVQSIRENGTFYLNSINTKISSTFQHKLRKKKKKNLAFNIYVTQLRDIWLSKFLINLKDTTPR